MIAAAALTVLAACVVLVPMDGVDAEGEEPEEPVVVATLTLPDLTVEEYTSLTEAVAAYNACTDKGDYILTLLTEIDEDVSINQPKSASLAKKLRICGNGNTVYSTITLVAYTNSGTASSNPYKDSISFENIRFKYTDGNPIYSSVRYQVHNISVEGCHFDMQGGDYAISLRNAVNVTIKGSTSEGGWGLFYARQASYGLTVEDATVSNCTYALSGYRLHGEVDLNGCTIDSKYGIFIRDTSSEITIAECKITAEYPFYYFYKDTSGCNAKLHVYDNEFISKTGNPWLTVDDSQKVTVYVNGQSMTLPETKTNVVVHDHRPLCGSDRTCEYCEDLTIPSASHEYTTDPSVLCRVHTCIHCGTSTVAVPCAYDDTIPLCKPSTCEYCGGSRELADHEPNGFPCTMTGCMKCGDRLEKTPHELATTHTCIGRPCLNGCGHVEPADTVDPVHEWDNTPACDGKACIHCGTPYPREAHNLGSTATCVDRTCSACGTVVRGDGVHDYETTGYRKVCSMCGDTVDLPVEDDDDDDWYWLWLQRQAAAKAEAERLAQERAEAEERKKVAAVAVAVGAAVAMVLLLMTTPRD